jgi:hypothetical protein
MKHSEDEHGFKSLVDKKVKTKWTFLFWTFLFEHSRTNKKVHLVFEHFRPSCLNLFVLKVEFNALRELRAPFIAVGVEYTGLSMLLPILAWCAPGPSLSTAHGATLRQKGDDGLKVHLKFLTCDVLQSARLSAPRVCMQVRFRARRRPRVGGHDHDLPVPRRRRWAGLWRLRLGPARLSWTLSHSDTPLYISLVIIHTEQTGWRRNDFNVHA